MLRKQSLWLLVTSGAMALALLLGMLGICRADSLTPPGSQSVAAPQAVQSAEMTVTAGLETYAPFATAYNADLDEYLVVWEGWQPGMGYDIRAQRVSGAGVRVGEVLTVTGLISLTGYRLPAVAYNSHLQEFLVVWADRTLGAFQGQRVSGDGTRIHSSFTIPMSFDHYLDSTSLVYAPDDHVFLLTWCARENTSRAFEVASLTGGTPGRFYTQILSDFGVAMTEGITTTTETYAQVTPAVAYAPGSHEFWVVWTEQFTITAQRVLTTGALAGGSFTIITDRVDMRAPAISNLSGAGEFLVTWEDHYSSSLKLQRTLGDTPSDIYARRVLSDGTLIGDAFCVADDGVAAGEPSIIYLAGQNRYVVSWTGFNSPIRNHYVKWLSADGTPEGGAFSIDSLPVYQHRAVITGSDDAFFIAWEDERDNISIRGRILERAWWTYLPLIVRTS